MTKNESIIKASGIDLTKLLPENLDDMKDHEIDLFIEENLLQPFESMHVDFIWEEICYLSDTIRDVFNAGVKEGKKEKCTHTTKNQKTL